ncbi:MAG: BNR-4 repeat-containing protein [Asgard group archaeon]|nr:BNR-4 repeat-containing protein [Asgard group archaeon]
MILDCIGKRKQIKITIIFSLLIIPLLFGTTFSIANNNEQTKIFFIQHVLTSQKNSKETPIGKEAYYANSTYKTRSLVNFEGKLVSSTGWNSTDSNIIYDPQLNRLAITWVDNYNPGGVNEEKIIYSAIRNEEKTWSNQKQITSFKKAQKEGYWSAFDNNSQLHTLISEFQISYTQIVDVPISSEYVVQPNTTVTITSGNSTYPVVVADEENNIHLVWRDIYQNPTGDIYYTLYNKTAQAWETPITRVTTNASPIEDEQPILLIDKNQTLHLLWADDRGGSHELYYSFKDKGNSTWSAEERITNTPYNPSNTKATINQETNKINIVFEDRSLPNNLYYASGPVKGNLSLWESPTLLTTQLETSGSFSLTSDQAGYTYLLTEELVESKPGIYLYYQRLGEEFAENKRVLSSENEKAKDPSIVSGSNGVFYTVYSKLIDTTHYEIQFKANLLDSDNDGLSDYKEIIVYGTEADSIDTDGDTLTDGDEVLVFGTNPLSTDSDGDEMPDNFEINNSLDPNNSADAVNDNDNDGLQNLDEYNEGTDPNIADTDGDEVNDGEEVNIYGTDPLDIDTDDDGLIDGYEVRWGLDPLIIDDITADPDNDGLSTELEMTYWTDPTNPDTDNDGYTDGEEVANNTDPLDPEDYPDLEEPRDYSRLITAIIISALMIVIVFVLTFWLARQFQPKKSKDRKDLELEEKELFSTSKSKGAKMTWEQKERTNIEMSAKKRYEQPTATSVSEILERKEEKESALEKRWAPDKEQIEQPTAEESKKPFQLPRRQEEMSKEEIEKKKGELAKEVSVLQQYLKELKEIKKKKMAKDALEEVSREELTEYATRSQAINSEINQHWNSVILPLIKGFEDALQVEVLKAEKLIDESEELANEILDILVKKELEFSEDEEKKLSIKEKARRAIEKAKEKDEQELNENEEENSSTE